MSHSLVEYRQYLYLLYTDNSNNIYTEWNAIGM